MRVYGPLRTAALLSAAVLGGSLALSVARARAAEEAPGWLQPPPVLQQPSRSGPEGPPRPFGALPRVGGAPRRTGPRWKRTEDRALLDGPFPASGLMRGISDGTLVLSESDQTRDLALERIRESGAGVVRIPVDWRALVDSDPGDFDQADPASPNYHFQRLDAAVRSAVSYGLQPLLVVSHAPSFAEAPGRWAYAYPGSWAPSPSALQAFATALARRYGGAFPDPTGAGSVLPRVRLFQAWNEPNLPHYLEPQWVVENGRWEAFSPQLYREMLNAFYAGVKSVLATDTVLSGGLAPNGDPVGVGRMAPLLFLRGMLCLGHTPDPCPDPPHFDVLAFHPLSVGDPDVPATSSLDVSISDAGKITGLLAAALRAHTALPVGSKPVWVTELNWESNPPSPQGVPGHLQGRWISRALHRLWIAGVTLVDWQFLIDPYPAARLVDPTGNIIEYARPAGLYSPGVQGDPVSAVPKPFLRGFTLPFDPLRVDSRRVRLWALLMRPGEPVVLQRRGRAGGWRSIAHLHADSRGILNVLVRLRGACEVRLQSGSLRSAAAWLPLDRSRL